MSSSDSTPTYYSSSESCGELDDEEEVWSQQIQQAKQQIQQKNKSKSQRPLTPTSDSDSGSDMSLASASPSPPRPKRKVISVRPSSTPILFEFQQKDYKTDIIETKIISVYHQTKFWASNNVSPKSWDHWCSLYPILAKWIATQQQDPMKVDRAQEQEKQAYNRNFNTSMHTVKSGLVLFYNYLHYVQYNTPTVLSIKQQHSMVIANSYNNFLKHQLHFAPSSVRNHLEHVNQLLTFQLKYVSAQEHNFCQEAKDQYLLLASVAKQDETIKREEFLDIENVQKLGLFVAKEQLQQAAESCSKVIAYYMNQTKKLNKEELRSYLMEKVWKVKGKRWVAIQKAVLYMFIDLTVGQRTQNLVNVTTTTLCKVNAQYVFSKIKVEKNQRLAVGVSQVMKKHYLAPDFTDVLDWWATLRDVVTNGEHDHWFMNFDGTALKNSDKYVSLFKEICLDLFNTPLVPKMFRKNVVHHALEAATTSEEVKLVAELASHSAEVAVKYYAFRKPKEKSQKIDIVMNKVSHATSALQQMKQTAKYDDDE